MKKNIVGLLVLSSVVLAGDFSRDSVNNVVLDHGTNLMWQDDTTPSTMDWQSAISYCENLTLATNSDWRLPNFNELYGIADRSRTSHAIDTAFQNVANLGYWSSTTYVANTSNGWNVYFSSGEPGNQDKTQTSYVRCVREN